MVVNPVGPVPIFDGAVPRIISATAGIGVTGGQLVFLSGANNAISSGANSYITEDLRVAGAASGGLFNGLVITPGLTASGTNNLVAIAMDGTWIITSAGTIIAGNAVFCNGADAVIGGNDTITGSYTPIGRALSPAASESFTPLKFF